MKIDELLKKTTDNKMKIANIKKWLQRKQPGNQYLIAELRSIERFLAYLEKEFRNIKKAAEEEVNEARKAKGLSLDEGTKRQLKILEEMYNCDKRRGRIVGIAVDAFGNTCCAYCGQRVDYSKLEEVDVCDEENEVQTQMES